MAIYSPAVACAEEHAGVGEQWGPGKWDTSVVLRCAWTDRYTLVNDILGNQREWPHSGFVVTPRAATARVVPDETQYTTTGQSINYEHALVTIGYSSAAEADLLAESLEPNTEFITQDPDKFRWGSKAGVPILEAEAPGKLVRSLTLVRSVFHLASIPIGLLTLPGGVNDAPYVSTLLGLTFPTGTLLFGGGPTNRTITTAGSEGWNLTLKFMYKPDGWNKFWRAAADPPDYEFMYHIDDVAGDPYLNYPPTDFSGFLS